MWELIEILILGKKGWRWYAGIIVVQGLGAIGYAIFGTK